MYEPYDTDDEFEGEKYPLHEYEFIAGDDDECESCAEVGWLPVKLSKGYFKGDLLIKRYTKHFDDYGELYPFKQILCEDCNFVQYQEGGDHPTEPDEEMIIQSKHQEAVDKISEFVLKIKKRQKAKKVIKDWFLQVRYDPSYKYCRRRVDALYDEEY